MAILLQHGVAPGVRLRVRSGDGLWATAEHDFVKSVARGVYHRVRGASTKARRAQRARIRPAASLPAGRRGALAACGSGRAGGNAGRLRAWARIRRLGVNGLRASPFATFAVSEVGQARAGTAPLLRANGCDENDGMLIDLHNHTWPRSHDSVLDPEDLITRAKELGLDGICLTEHDAVWNPTEAQALAEKHDFLVIPGVEISTDDGHILAYGVGEVRLRDAPGGQVGRARQGARWLPGGGASVPAGDPVEGRRGSLAEGAGTRGGQSGDAALRRPGGA